MKILRNSMKGGEALVISIMKILRNSMKGGEALVISMLESDKPGVAEFLIMLLDPDDPDMTPELLEALQRAKERLKARVK